MNLLLSVTPESWESAKNLIITINYSIIPLEANYSFSIGQVICIFLIYEKRCSDVIIQFGERRAWKVVIHFWEQGILTLKNIINICFFYNDSNNCFSMKNYLLFLLVLIAVGTTTPPCPVQTQVGSLISARVVVADQKSLVSLVQGVDIQCYNYSLPYSFDSAPDVAIAVHDFSIRSSNDIFFSIKPLEGQSLAYLPFLIRTYWKYTAWVKIGFSFLAENRRDLETGYHQVDTTFLGGCESGKNIQISLPFRKRSLTRGQYQHSIFLNGFEVSTQKFNSSSFSPFEVQLVESTASDNGIVVLVSVTTITQVVGLHVSFVAWSLTNMEIVGGNFIYQMGQNEIVHTPSSQVGRNYARIHGITGFIISNNFQPIDFGTTWNGNNFVFDLSSSQRLTKYFSYQYLFFIGSECSDCNGYPLSYEGRCLAYCPPGTYPTAQKTCIFCGDGYMWNGNSCQKQCQKGQILNSATRQCECPFGQNWNGNHCISCNGGKQFDQSTKTCECSSGTRWNGYTCAFQNPCSNGKEWDYFLFSCSCPMGTQWNGTYCFKPPTCRGGQYLQGNQCVCPPNTYFRDGYCQSTGCSGGQNWNGIQCACDNGYNWNGTVCLLCINEQIWNPASRSCECPQGFRWNGNFCEKFESCSGGRYYNSDYKICLCPDANFWNGAQCMIKPNCCCGKAWNDKTFNCQCPEGFNNDGKNCVLCTNGKTWDSFTRTCICPPGTQWNQQFCTVIENCNGGMIWNQNTWACECPSTTVWTFNYCVANPCQNGQVWDNMAKICKCVNNYQLINNRCTPPEVSCRNGKIWNSANFVCECPAGTWDSGSSCDIIKQCRLTQVYSPLNNKCTCPTGLVWLSSKNSCADPTCPRGQRWDGQGCVEISCPPGSYYNSTQCIYPNPGDKCEPWEYYNGVECAYYQDTCPLGTRWDGYACNSIGGCPPGYYGEANNCTPLPQRCFTPSVWRDGKCITNGQCPFGSFKSGSTCQPYSQCQNGQTWNTDLIQCVCPEGTGWNGRQCVTCAGGQIWNIYEGCVCPEGSFFKGEKCEQPSQSRCNLIPNAFWNFGTNQCICDPGFTVVGYQCICKGVPFEHFCDRCAHRPHSEWRFGQCQCQQGYTLFGAECLPNQNDGKDKKADCTVGTFFDDQQKKCLPCPDGCLTCTDSYTCQVCGPDFIYDFNSQLCIEKCGDGKKYIAECDDGNINPNDGCDSSCRIEAGYTCRGGSPNSADNCIVYSPTAVTLVQTGQIRYATKIVLNVKLDYMPQTLIQSAECQDRCSQILIVGLIGESASRVTSTFIAGSRYAFSVQISFDRPYMKSFTAEVSVNPSLGSRYFGSVSINTKLRVSINPALLALAEKGKKEDFLQ